jgi:hypothetical protein
MAATHSLTRLLSGREFSRKDFKLIKDIIRLCPHLSRKELSKVISENLSWYQSNGEPKHRACMKVLEKLEALGHIKLPPLRYSPLKGVSQKVKITGQSDAGSLLTGRIDEYGAVVIEPVEGEAAMKLWGEYIERYHYLGCKRAFGNQQRYFVRLADGTLVGCLLYSAPAWAVACRDEWIGWDRLQRTRGLHLIVNMSRFLIFPWVKVKNLASRILSLSVKQLSGDWLRRHTYRPVLIESFVDRALYRGVCYRAANWQSIGLTTGRGRMDRWHKGLSTIKEVFVYPLSGSFREELKGRQR